MPRWCACWEPIAQARCMLWTMSVDNNIRRLLEKLTSCLLSHWKKWEPLVQAGLLPGNPEEATRTIPQTPWPVSPHQSLNDHMNLGKLTSLSLRFSFFEKGNNTSIQFLGPLWSLVITYIVLITAPGKQYIPNKSWLYLLYYCWCCLDDDDDGDDNMTMHIVSIP